jgi:catechol 2,3-dioxygenase-like lactoylglutathione lyase family enzyme
MTVRIEAVHPVLMSRNVEVSVRFYAQLGFHLTFQDNPVQPRYAAVRRDDVEVHLQWHDVHQWAHPIDRPTYRFVVSDVDAFHDELAAAPALHEALRSDSPWRRPGDTPWGTREFHVRDPDGNGLQFYRMR